MIVHLRLQREKQVQRWQVLPSAAIVCPSFPSLDAGYRRNPRFNHAAGGGVAVHR